MFRDRGLAEEAAYFHQQDAKLLEKLRQKARLGDVAHALADKLHADEPALLERIKKLGVRLDTGSAFILAPLLEVAWADGDVSHAERNAILHLAEQRGVVPGSADHRQLLEWFAHRPSEEIFRTALEAIRIGISVLPPAEAKQQVAAIIRACEEVAHAAGGLAGLLQLEAITQDENAVISAVRDHLAT
jgi:hypothetical protein